MNQLRATAIFGLVFIVLIIAAATVLRPLLPWLLALFFIATVLKIAIRD